MEKDFEFDPIDICFYPQSRRISSDRHLPLSFVASSVIESAVSLSLIESNFIESTSPFIHRRIEFYRIFFHPLFLFRCVDRWDLLERSGYIESFFFLFFSTLSVRLVDA